MLEANCGLRLAVVPAIDTFIDRVPTAATVESHVHDPPVPPDNDQDVGRLPDPLSNDPLGAILETVAGNSRYTNPDTTPDDPYSTPPTCRLLTDPLDPNVTLIPSDVTNDPCARSDEEAPASAQTKTMIAAPVLRIGA